MVSFESTDPVEQFLIEVHRLCDRDGRIGGYRLGEDPPDELRIARILVAKIAAMEREACAKVCDAEAKRALWNWDNDTSGNQPFWNGGEQLASSCAAAIRARGDA